MCPSTQVRIEPGIHADEGPLGRYRRIVVAPPPDDGVEAVDEPLLGGGSSVPDFLMHLLEMGMLGRFRWLDAGGETQRDALAGFAGFGLANRVLSDMESQEIEPCGVTVQVAHVMLRSGGLLQPQGDTGGVMVQAAPCTRPGMRQSDRQGHGAAAA